MRSQLTDRLFAKPYRPAVGLFLLLLLPPPALAAPPIEPQMVDLPWGFALSATEITFDQWQVCVAEGACRSGQDDHGWGRQTRPVINVTYDDAAAYARWLGSRWQRPCRLPREDEWERAARADRATAYWWGDEIGTDHANCRHCGGEWDGKMTAPVGSFPANPYGLYDMEGNVWEWTTTCADDTCQRRIAKGGAWYYIPQQAKPTARTAQSANLWSYTVGFRVLCETPP